MTTYGIIDKVLSNNLDICIGKEVVKMYILINNSR